MAFNLEDKMKSLKGCVTWRQLRGLKDLEFRVRNSLLGYRGSIYIWWRPTVLNTGGWIDGWAGGWEEARAHVPTS